MVKKKSDLHLNYIHVLLYKVFMLINKPLAASENILMLSAFVCVLKTTASSYGVVNAKLSL